MRPLTPVALLLLAALGPGCDRAPTVEHEAQAATPSSSPAQNRCL